MCDASCGAYYGIVSLSLVEPFGGSGTCCTSVTAAAAAAGISSGNCKSDIAGAIGRTDMAGDRSEVASRPLVAGMVVCTIQSKSPDARGVRRPCRQSGRNRSLNLPCTESPRRSPPLRYSSTRRRSRTGAHAASARCGCPSGRRCTTTASTRCATRVCSAVHRTVSLSAL